MSPAKTFKQLKREDARRIVLDLLNQDAGYELSAAMIQTGLAQFGHRPSADQLKTELNWLAEQDYLNIETRGDNIMVAKLTQRGADVAEGRAAVHGVAKPPIGD